MATNNPKVSAYVPEPLKERLTQFRESRGLSESQAVTIILAEYFQMPEVLGRPSEGLTPGGVTLARMEALEQELASFAKSVEQRFQELGTSIKEFSELPVNQGRQEEIILNQANADLLSHKPLGELPSGVKVFQASQASQGSLWGRSLSEPSFPQQSKNANLAQEESSSIGSTESKLPQEIQPIPGVKLSTLRFGIKNSTFRGSKSSKSNEDFIEWTRKKDPDGIPWKYVEAPLNGYVPAEELPSELLGRLLKWINENIEPKQS